MDEKDLNSKKQPNDRLVDVIIAIVRFIFIGFMAAFVSIPFVAVYILFNEITNEGFDKFAVMHVKFYAATYFVVYFILYWKLILNNDKTSNNGRSKRN